MFDAEFLATASLGKRAYQRPALPPTVTLLGELGRDNALGVVGHDGGHSIALPSGGRLWTFADTWIGAIEHGRRRLDSFLPSSAALQDGASCGAPIRYLTDSSGRVRQLIPLREGDFEAGILSWPQSGVVVGERVYLYYLRIEKNEARPVGMNFDIRGLGLASAELESLDFSLESDGELLFDWEVCAFASAVYSEGGYVYAIGGPPLGCLRPCRLWRAPASRLADRRAYEYWTGDGFSCDILRSQVILDAGASEMSLSRVGERFVLTATEQFSAAVQMRTAPAPWGPWSAPVTLFDATTVEGAYCYGAKLHRVSECGRYAEVSWNSNGPIALHFDHLDLYWIHVAQVELPGSLRAELERPGATGV